MGTDDFMEREERKMKLFMGLFLFMIAIWLFLMFRGSGRSDWTIWIPLGPVSIGYGTKGFQWSFWWFA